MFKKKKKPEQKPSQAQEQMPLPEELEKRKKSKFSSIMNCTERYFAESKSENNDIDKALLLSFVIDQLGREIAVEGNGEIIRDSNTQESEAEYEGNNYHYQWNLPELDVPEAHLGKKLIDISKCNTYTEPWVKDRLVKSLQDVFKIGFKHDISHASGYYYPELNFAVTINSRHHTTAGIYFGKCLVEFEVISLKPYFRKVITDGAYFYYTSQDGVAKKKPVHDGRFAAMFALAQMKYRESMPDVKQPLEFEKPIEMPPEQMSTADFIPYINSVMESHKAALAEAGYWRLESDILRKQKASLKEKLEKLQSPAGWTPEEREKQWEAERSSMQEENEKLRGELKHLLQIL